MKSPAELRQDIRTLASHIQQIQNALQQRAGTETAQIGKECERTAQNLAELVAQELPEDYKVAVVGRFKTGKSAFVNELLGMRLASEDTNPETAAVTTFQHGQKVKATIAFLPAEEWAKQRQLYKEDPNHPDAHRLKKWHDFENNPRKNKDGEEINFDLRYLETTFVHEGGHHLVIELEGSGSKKDITQFRRKLKDFTTGTMPHHCLVQSIAIEAPAPILDGGVLLIDTPGLDDTERFRVSLTGEIVEGVDAILLLTKSGGSYGQSDKDFLLSLLRKGTVKQLIVVVTQVDVTYQQHLDNAEDNDEDPDSIHEHIARERRRLEKELAATLAELGQDDSPTVQHYLQQLGDIDIAFTSAKLHRSWQAKRPLICQMRADDPGGINKLTARLAHMLSKQSRLARVSQHIAEGARAQLLQLQSVLDAKLAAIRDIKDKEEAERKLRSFREEFATASSRFEASIDQAVTLLTEQLKEQREQHGLLIENISLLAREELADFELQDVGRHWRTRRSGYWGYMRGFQVRIANRIFPKVQQMLGNYTEQFASYVHAFETHLDTLSRDGERTAGNLDLGTTLDLNVTGKLKDSLQHSLDQAQETIADEEQKISVMLEDFVTDEVSDRIDEVRSAVTDIWGTGTTAAQSAEIQDFYRQLKQLLSSALTEHLRKRGKDFCRFLVSKAKSAPQSALQEVNILLEQADDNIRAAAAAHVADQRQEVETLVGQIKTEQTAGLTHAQHLLDFFAVTEGDETDTPAASKETPQAESSAKKGAQPKPKLPAKAQVITTGAAEAQAVADTAKQQPTTAPIAPGKPAASTAADWAESLHEDASVLVERIHLRDGERNKPFEAIFAVRYLQGAVRAQLIDPYLDSPHQTRNLKELLLHLGESAKLRELEVLTRPAPIERAERQQRELDSATEELFRNYGAALTVQRRTDLHDRYFLLDTGVLFKLGRGLDIYKPALGLAAHRPANRQVRNTTIDIFCTPQHPLAADAQSADATSP